ncbi:MAG: hypothetical protein H0X37_16825 [Herpetosiphonaceae bacterium]|nr:hypothetical protein [Herpetosiphonaceae bacterium]
MAHDRIINQHQPGLALYPRNLSYDLLPLIGPSGWSLLRALHDHADEQALTYRGTRPIAPSSEEMQALAGVGEASLLVIKELLHTCGCLSWEEIRGKQEPRPGRQVKQQPTRSLVYYLHPLTGLTITIPLVQRVIRYAQCSERAQAYLKANGLFRAQPAFLPTSVWPSLLPYLLKQPDWQALFEQMHGQAKHRQYREAVECWISSAAEVVATLELEQQGVVTPHTTWVIDRALIVRARWQKEDTAPSSGQHGVFTWSQEESAPTPHTPVNELTNQSRNERGALGQRAGSSQAENGDVENGDSLGKREPRQQTKAAIRKERRADAGIRTDLPAEAVDQLTYTATYLLPQPPQPYLQNDRIKQDDGQAEARSEAPVQAEVALWAILPDILEPTGMESSSQHSSLPPYSPTTSEQRQARRLLRRHSYTTIISALRATVIAYRPGPRQPSAITRFGFAAGLPVFRATLERSANDAEPLCPDSPAPANDARLGFDRPAAEPDSSMVDFWHEYERVTARRSTRAEHYRLELLAQEVDWHHLLIWLDRWEHAHAGTAATLTPGYFEACAITAAAQDVPPVVHTPTNVLAPASAMVVPASLSPTQHHTYDRLVALGIKKAQTLALAPGTTPELVEAWALAARDVSVKNPSAYIAAGITSGQLPKVRPYTNGGVSASPAIPRGVDIIGNSSSTAATTEVWMVCLKHLQADLPPNDFETWLRPCALVELDERLVVIAAPNIFVRQELEQRYHAVVQRAVTAVTGRDVEPLFVIASGPAQATHQ